MPYLLITDRDSKNFTPAASVPATFGRARLIESITIHWWGLPEWGDTFDGVCEFLCTNDKPTSAHEVIEAGRVAVIVNHQDAAWAAGSAAGNASSLHLELRPRASAEDYATAAERIRDLRSYYGDLPLIPHNHWQATQCPGHWDLAKLDRLARTAPPAASTTPPTKEPFTVAQFDEIMKKLQRIEDIAAENQRRINSAPAKVWATTVKRNGQNISVLQEVADAKTFAEASAKNQLTPADLAAVKGTVNVVVSKADDSGAAKP